MGSNDSIGTGSGTGTGTTSTTGAAGFKWPPRTTFKPAKAV